MINFKEKVIGETEEGEMLKFWQRCARKEVDGRYKVASSEARKLLQLLTIRHKFLCFDVTFHVDIDCARSSLCHELIARMGDNWNVHPVVVDSNSTWDWLYISNRKTLAQQWKKPEKSIVFVYLNLLINFSHPVHLRKFDWNKN